MSLRSRISGIFPSVKGYFPKLSVAHFPLDSLGCIPLIIPPMDPQVQLLSEVEAFLLTHPMADTTFGLRAVNDGKFMGRLRAGENMTLATLKRVQRYIRDSQPLDEEKSP